MTQSNVAELADALAGQILQEHLLAEEAAKAGKEHIEEALLHAVRAGEHIADAEGLHRGKLLGWLKANVKALTIARAKAYLTLYTTNKKRECPKLDHRQLTLLLGMEADKPNDQPAKPKTGGESWVSWIGKTVGRFREIETTRPLATWDREEKDALAASLEPIVELYNRAKA